MDVYFYTKEGCPLCERAEGALEPLVSKYSLTVYRTDIKCDQEAYRKYRDMIPVIELPDGNVLWGRIDRDEIERGLRSSLK